MSLKSALLTGHSDAISNKVLLMTKQFKIDKDRNNSLSILPQLIEHRKENQMSQTEIEQFESEECNRDAVLQMQSYAIRQILDGDPYLKQDNQLRNRNSLMFWKHHRKR